MKLLLVCTLVFAAPLQAQIERLDLSGMSLPELLQVNITGSTLKAETLKTVPSAVTVFTREEIRRTGIDTLDELMNLVPGFQSYRSTSSSLHKTMGSKTMGSE